MDPVSVWLQWHITSVIAQNTLCSCECSFIYQQLVDNQVKNISATNISFHLLQSIREISSVAAFTCHLKTHHLTLPIPTLNLIDF